MIPPDLRRGPLHMFSRFQRRRQPQLTLSAVTGSHLRSLGSKASNPPLRQALIHLSMVLRETCTPRPPGPACTCPAMRRTTRPRCFVVSPTPPAAKPDQPVPEQPRHPAPWPAAAAARVCSAEDI